MRNIINNFKQKRAEDSAMREQLNGLTDPHFLTIAEFDKNFTFNTGRAATAAECDEVRTLLEA